MRIDSGAGKMRDNGPITTKEVPLPDGMLLVSQTDVNGRITFVNNAFVEVSGFTQEELIGAPHNLVRHPHMPQAAFRDLRLRLALRPAA